MLGSFVQSDLREVKHETIFWFHFQEFEMKIHFDSRYCLAIHVWIRNLERKQTCSDWRMPFNKLAMLMFET